MAEVAFKPLFTDVPIQSIQIPKIEAQPFVRRIIGEGARNSVGTSTIYTIPADMLFILDTICLAVASTGAAAFKRVEVEVNGVPIICVSIANGQQTATLSFPNGLHIDGGEVISLVVSQANADARVCFTGKLLVRQQENV